MADALNTALTTVLDSDVVITDALEAAKAATNVTTAPTTVTVVAGTQTAIQEAKTLIASVRSMASAASSKTDTTSLASRLQTVADAANHVPGVLDDSTVNALTAVAEAINRFNAGVDVTGLNFELKSGHSFSSPSASIPSACRYFTNNNFDTQADKATNYLGCRVIDQVLYTWDNVLSTSTVALAVHHLGLIHNADGTFTVESALKKVPVIGPWTNAPTLGTAASLSQKQTATVTTGAAATQVTMSGQFAPGVESVWVDTATGGYNQERVLGTYNKVSLSLNTTQPTAGTERYSLKGDVSVYGGSDGQTIQSRASVLEGTYIEETQAGTSKVQLMIEAQLKAGFKIGGTLAMTNFADTGKGWSPQNGTFSGYITDVGGSAKLFEGDVTLTMPNASARSWTVGLNGSLVTYGSNTLKINVTGTPSATVDGDYSVSGRYTHAGTTFLLTVLSSKATPDNNQLAMTTTEGGVGFVAKPSDKTVDIKKGSIVLGTFDVSSSKLQYADGTYEQF